MTKKIHVCAVFHVEFKNDVRKMLGDRLRCLHRRLHRHTTADGGHVVADVTAEEDAYRIFEGDIRILRKISPRAMPRVTNMLKQCVQRVKSTKYAGQVWPPSLTWWIPAP